jgi:LPXTG-motif cell wall-anchored protein
VDSFVGTTVPNLSVLQGLLGIKDVNIAGVSTNASATASIGNTGIVGIGSVDVLSLQGLLGGLGLNNLADLPLGTLTSLLDQLGLTVPTGALGLGNLTGGGINGLLANVTGLLNVKNGLAGAADCNALTSLVNNNLGGLGDLGGLLSGSNSPLGGLLGILGVSSGSTGINSLIGTGCSAVDTSKAGILSIIDPILGTADTGLLGNATDVVDGLLGVLNGAPLISLQGVSLSAMAKAADTLANSSATTSANFGHLLVGGKDLGVLDLNATVAQVSALKDNVLGVLNGITSTLGLGNLLDIGILERTASVKAEGSYNVASSGLDLLRVSINPPANLGGLLSGAGGLLSGAGSIGSLLSGLNLPVGNLPLGTDTLAQAFGLTSLLSTPTTIKVGSIGANADYTTAVAGENLTSGPADGSVSPGGTLPRTGGTNGAWFAALAAISLAGAFGITRTLRKSPAPQGEDH